MKVELLKHILFIDIETASCVSDYNMLSEGMQEQWIRKTKFLKAKNGEDTSPSVLFEDRAGIFSEFAKVVCIGLGCLTEKDGEWKMVMKALSGDDEHELLVNFCEALSKFNSQFRDLKFCGHNIKEFDLPFLCRRMIIHGMQLPQCMQLHGKKPWEVPHLDTLELWRFGDYKHYTSLALLAEVLGIPSPKDDIDGSMVSEVYWKEKNLQRINRYCLQDVLTTAKVFLRLKGITQIQPEPQIID
ncbi:MAG TPA: 3'-5' exonuclease [Flavipsychrobacter sp.]|nr:3'-5' exonuclease [Flavipsychrobacter sp.]